MTDDYAFGFDRPEDSPGFLLWQTTIIWQRQIKKVLDPYNVSHAQFVIMAVTLWLTSTGKNPNQNTICQLSKLDKMTVSKSLKKLVSLKLIKRYEDTNDTRAKLLELSLKGEELIRTLIPVVENIDEKFFEKLDSQKQKSLKIILRELNDKNS